MNLNDPEMQKQLQRWQDGIVDKLAGILNSETGFTPYPPRELQPARGWADYDRQFLAELGISSK